MAKIYAPNTQYTGVSCGVRFVDGVGETTDEKQLEWLEQHGYRVEPEPDPDPEGPKGSGKGNEGKK